MAKMMVLLLLLGTMVGCVSVSDGKNSIKFDNIQIADSRIALGLAYLEEGQWNKARENLERAVQVAPKYHYSLISFAHYLQKVGENEQAEQHYKIALRYSPNNGDLLNNYGAFLCRQDRFDEAQRAFAKAIIQPQYYLLSDSYENAALCALKEGDKDEAKIWFTKAVDHEPNRPLATVWLASIEVAENQLNDARLRLFYLHKQYGYRPNTLLKMIELESKAKRPNEMDKFANLLAKRFPESKEYRQYLANEY